MPSTSKVPDCGSERGAGEQHSGLSEMAATKKAQAVLRTILSERSEHSPNISPANTSDVSEHTAVTPTKSQSQTS